MSNQRGDSLGDDLIDQRESQNLAQFQETIRMSQDNLSDPLAGLKSSIFMSMGLSNLPEYRGVPNEDIEQFLREFGRATTALSPAQKCVALKKALVGDASIFAKNYLKTYLSLGQWKEAKKTLRTRFSPIEPSLLYRSQLNQLSFDPSQSTLLGYVDRYAKLYKKIHPSSGTNELIQDLSLNLGHNIILKLNHLSAEWRRIEDFENFRSLISRLERDIMSLETASASHTSRELVSTVNKLVTSALQPPLKEFQDLIGRLNKTHLHEPSKANLAVIKNGGYPDKRQDQLKESSGKRRERDWDSDRDKDRKPGFKKAKDLRRAYEEKFGEIPGPCYLCGGQHFRRHCPLDMPDLKDREDAR